MNMFNGLHVGVHAGVLAACIVCNFTIDSCHGGMASQPHTIRSRLVCCNEPLWAIPNKHLCRIHVHPGQQKVHVLLVMNCNSRSI